MPNHCDHDCWIRGPADDVAVLIETCLTADGAIRADAVLPYPEEFRLLDEAAKAWDAAQRAGENPEGSTRPKDGFNSGGYEWRITHWGTKWGCYEGNGITEVPESRPGWRQIRLGFLTAWSPAYPVYTALAQRYPRCTFRYRYYEGGCGFRGTLRYDRGTCQSHGQHTYKGPRGG